jgi:hypothetical protein
LILSPLECRTLDPPRPMHPLMFNSQLASMLLTRFASTIHFHLHCHLLAPRLFILQIVVWRFINQAHPICLHLMSNEADPKQKVLDDVGEFFELYTSDTKDSMPKKEFRLVQIFFYDAMSLWSTSMHYT